MRALILILMAGLWPVPLPTPGTTARAHHSSAKPWSGISATPKIDCVVKPGAVAFSNGLASCPVVMRGTPMSATTDRGSPAIAFNGTTDYADLGDVANPTGSFTLLCEASPTDTGTYYLIGKDDGDTVRQWLVEWAWSGYFVAYLWKNTSSAANPYMNIGSPGWHSVGLSFQWVADGTSIVRMATDGSSMAPIADAPGPISSTGTPLIIGGRAGAAGFAGSISRCTYYDVSVTDEQLATATAR
jgi:hypothetical protein